MQDHRGANLPITIDQAAANDRKSHTAAIQVDLEKPVAPLLIPQRAFAAMRGEIDAITAAMEIPGAVIIHLNHSTSGHVLLPGRVRCHAEPSAAIANPNNVFPVQQTDPVRLGKWSGPAIMKIHFQLGQ